MWGALDRYTTLKDPPLVKDEGFDLHPDLATSDPAGPGFHNYLDEFLSAIKVFGYLEKPVFHELARHLQTRRLVAGDTLDLSSDKSFYIVVDGCVQVFAQTGQSSSANKYDDEDDNGYQLLNNVQSGGTLSSLFTILSLFTEDVELRYDESPGEGEGERPMRSRTTSFTDGGRDADVEDFDLNTSSSPRSANPNQSSNFFKSPAFNSTTTPKKPRPPFSRPGAPSNRRPSRSPNRPSSSASFNSSSTTTRTSTNSDGTATDTEHEPSPRFPPASSTAGRSPLDTITSAPGTPGF
ncbi:hypothetical protein P7C70_g9601, partial [Phenoliferia sp. Uapishka_3]